ncbi:anti-sigma factor [Pseudomonas sp. FW306-02-F02-AA]|uniref:Anti-sigma factor n=1 Tax=Pseudomonas fluorescens TaxID=294 RepID=A0A0N9WDL2_PSEFL|nr:MULTISPECIES: anti-sigma factor [Pseudomonas]ALI00925.1 anti-sigma factor [Pseudomonas fluorescens]PMZ02770.1 anti-sigma factor [Pseudomonas sp. FW306-02-F02-AB]PMZ09487.1 anti-sigma factor [Pseudomonas sp. FW306-02-H06C]PMZ15069.1 anti-sigma factor [Pseudomonas sp. FW306-02-F02-AA]PMZ23570.1 anti-sigma factor [Pseudomonas sp. FW306-02-F08-AA]
MNYQSRSLRRALAADYAIGLMPAAARRRFEQLLLDDAELRIELAKWQESLASLNEPLVEVPVPDRVWTAINARIEPQELHVPAKRPFWNWLRITLAVCSLLVAVTLGILYNRDSSQYSATLLSASAQPALRIKAHDNYLQVEPLALAAVAPGHSLELWAVPADGKPISLGVIPAGGKGQVALSEKQHALLGKPIALAVSLEPEGGSPTGQPTGPVLYQGALAGL